jgi:hypothetical protein
VGAGKPTGRGRRALARSGAVFALVVMSGAVGCGDDDDDDSPRPEDPTTEAPEVSTTEPPPVADTEPSQSEQPLPLGSEAAIVDPLSGQEIGYLTIRSVEVDPGCSNPAALPPENGHFLIVDLTAGVYEEADDTLSLIGAEFRVEGPTGETENGVGTTFAALACDVNRTTSTLIDIPPGNEYNGPIVLDSAHTSGTLVFAPITMNESKWAY